MTIAISGTNGITLDGQFNSASSMGFKNRIINGAMVIFQRGTAATTNLAYSVDRWRYDKGNDATESVSQNSDAPAGFSYSLRNTISVGDATIGSAQFSGLQQAIEGYNVADLGWGTANAKTITLSFWIRSSVTGQYVGNVRNNDDTRINPFNFTISTANTWEQKTVTITGDTGGTWNTTNGAGIQIAIYAALGSSFLGGTAGTWGASPNFGCGSPVNGIASNGNIFAISGVQLEKGSTATSFDYRPYGTELALCQRYFQPVGNGSSGRTAGATTIELVGNFVNSFRAAPTLTFGGFSGANTTIGQFSVGNVTGTALSSYLANANSGFYAAITVSGATTGSIAGVVNGDVCSASAEL
jgi:hypothetical protein